MYAGMSRRHELVKEPNTSVDIICESESAGTIPSPSALYANSFTSNCSTASGCLDQTQTDSLSVQHSVLSECSCNAVRVLYIIMCVCVLNIVKLCLRLRKVLGFKIIYKNII